MLIGCKRIQLNFYFIPIFFKPKKQMRNLVPFY